MSSRHLDSYKDLAEMNQRLSASDFIAQRFSKSRDSRQLTKSRSAICSKTGGKIYSSQQKEKEYYASNDKDERPAKSPGVF
jgi:hypothetical protein